MGGSLGTRRLDGAKTEINMLTLETEFKRGSSISLPALEPSCPPLSRPLALFTSFEFLMDKNVVPSLCLDEDVLIFGVQHTFTDELLSDGNGHSVGHTQV